MNENDLNLTELLEKSKTKSANGNEAKASEALSLMPKYSKTSAEPTLLEAERLPT